MSLDQKTLNSLAEREIEKLIPKIKGAKHLKPIDKDVEKTPASI